MHPTCLAGELFARALVRRIALRVAEETSLAPRRMDPSTGALVPAFGMQASPSAPASQGAPALSCRLPITACTENGCAWHPYKQQISCWLAQLLRSCSDGKCRVCLLQHSSDTCSMLQASQRAASTRPWTSCRQQCRPSCPACPSRNAAQVCFGSVASAQSRQQLQAWNQALCVQAGTRGPAGCRIRTARRGACSSDLYSLPNGVLCEGLLLYAARLSCIFFVVPGGHWELGATESYRLRLSPGQ